MQYSVQNIVASKTKVKFMSKEATGDTFGLEAEHLLCGEILLQYIYYLQYHMVFCRCSINKLITLYITQHHCPSMLIELAKARQAVNREFKILVKLLLVLQI